MNKKPALCLGKEENSRPTKRRSENSHLNLGWDELRHGLGGYALAKKNATQNTENTGHFKSLMGSFEELYLQGSLSLHMTPQGHSEHLPR